MTQGSGRLFGGRGRWLAVLAALLLQACGGSEEEGAQTSVAPGPSGQDADVDVEVELAGTVSDGPIVGASIRVTANDGSVVGAAVTDPGAAYNVQLKTKGRHYPLVIEATGGIDLVTDAPPGFTVAGVALSPGKKAVAQLSPFTTLIVATARQMSGGLNSANLSVAASSVMREFNAGLTSAISTDPMSTRVDDTNLAEHVKGSEAVAEIFRRVHATMALTGISMDEVIDAIGADITDGTLDGSGGAAANRQVSALTLVAAAQVMIEAMRNDIHVGGESATGVLDKVILQLAEGPNPLLTDSRPVTTPMIVQARRGVDAAIAVGDNGALRALRSALNSVTTGMSAADAVLLLPSPDQLDGTLEFLRTATSAEVNAALTGTPIDPTSPPPPENSAPVIAGSPASSVMSGSRYDFVPSASDADGDSLTYEIVRQPVWASFNPASGALSGTPAEAHVGLHDGIVITVSDGSDSASLGPFSIMVESEPAPPPPDPTPTNTPPVISGSPASSVSQDAHYRFRPSASDADGDSLRFAISGRPRWASFSATTGTLAGTPAAGDVGTHSGITITVSDGSSTSALGPFSIDVLAVENQAPEISGTPPASVMRDTFYRFAPTASDGDGDRLTFSIGGKPGWASFDFATGVLSGTPGAGDVGRHSGITIAVTDGEDIASLGPFSIDVLAAENNPPVISGSPAGSVLQETSYSFVPTASDADGDRLTFGIDRLPRWASFDATTGALTGTPGIADVGTYTGITITVTDGEDSASLGPFAIAVEAVSTGTATLSWTPPTTNADGTPLVDLAGYLIRWGTVSGAYTDSATVMNAGVSSYVVENLGAGAHYFVVLAINDAGLQSAPSNEAMKLIN